MATLKRHKSSDYQSTTSESMPNTPRNIFESATSPRNIANKEKYAAALSKNLGVPSVLEILKNQAKLSENMPRLDVTRLHRIASYRAVLVDIICTVCEKLNLHRTASANAVWYVDRILSQSTVSGHEEYVLLAAACLKLAVAMGMNYREKPDDQTLVVAFQTAIRDGNLKSLTCPELRRMYLVVLSGLQYKLYPLTASHFVEALMDLRLLSNLKHNDRFDEREMDAQLAKYASFWLDFSLRYPQFQELTSLEMVMVVVAAARKSMELQPYRPIHLEELLGIEYDDDLHCYLKELWRVYENEFGKESEQENELANSPMGVTDLCTKKMNPV